MIAMRVYFLCEELKFESLNAPSRPLLGGWHGEAVTGGCADSNFSIKRYNCKLAATTYCVWASVKLASSPTAAASIRFAPAGP